MRQEIILQYSFFPTPLRIGSCFGTRAIVELIPRTYFTICFLEIKRQVRNIRVFLSKDEENSSISNLQFSQTKDGHSKVRSISNIAEVDTAAELRKLRYIAFGTRGAIPRIRRTQELPPQVLRQLLHLRFLCQNCHFSSLLGISLFYDLP